MKSLKSDQPDQRLKALQLGTAIGLAALFLAVLVCGLGNVPTTRADPGVLYVDWATGQDVATCGTTGVPCKTISYTLNGLANGGATIRVAQGVYTENLTVDKQVMLEGGYVPSGTLWLTRTGETVIDGSNSRTVFGDWDGSQVRQVAVLSDGTEYKMWFDGVNLVDENQIGLATSDDGISWTKHLANPVLTGTIGAWDEYGEHDPFVMKENGIYKMWYEGSDGDVRRLGYATSTNGIDWNKYAGNPILQPDPGGYDQEVVGHGSLLNDGGTYKLWYHAVGNEGCLIAYATSPDGMTGWSKSGPVLVSQSGSWDEYCVWGPSVLKFDGVYWMWYSSWGEQGGAIGVVTSTNGITWTRLLAKPVVTDTTSIGDPHVISAGGKLKMWYHDWDQWTINYAESNDGISWTKSPSNPGLIHGTSGQWGQPVAAFVEGSDGSVLDGFTVRNGQAEEGGGIFIDDAEVTVRNCTVVSNTSQEGGGIGLRGGANAKITSNHIFTNTANGCGGGGVSIAGGSVGIVDGNHIYRNTAGCGGGGVSIAGGAVATLTNNLIVWNYGIVAWDGDGVGIWDDATQAWVVNNTIAFNEAEGVQANGGWALVRNNVIYSNDGGIHNYQSGATMSSDHNALWDNGWNYANVTPGTGDISKDPLFIDVTNGDYHLQADSPCIDAGSATGAPAIDIEGTLRDATPDIGAYERTGSRIFLPLMLRNAGIVSEPDSTS